MSSDFILMVNLASARLRGGAQAGEPVDAPDGTRGDLSQTDFVAGDRGAPGVTVSAARFCRGPPRSG